MLTPEQARDLLPSQIDGVLELIGDTDPDAAVPSCPGWAVRDLVVHLGDVHRWVLQAMTTGNAQDPKPAVVPDQELAAWYRRVAGEMVELFTATDPAAPCWTFGPRPHEAAFWFRRQVHEVAMHRWDLGTATGLDVGYAEELAVDGIDEVASMLFPRQVRLGRMEPLRASLGLDPAGSERRWVLSGDGTAPVADPEAVVSGPAAALLLLLWGRVCLEDPRLEVSGQRAAADAVLGARLVP